MTDSTTSSHNPAQPVEDDVYSLQAKITKQQSVVRQLKKDLAAGAGAAGDVPSQDTLTNEINLLVQLRAQLAKLEKDGNETYEFNRKGFDELLLRKMYVIPSFEIHNGPSGLFDYGPPACSLKANVLNLWRSHFVHEESMLEMECTCLTPSSVLEASGHVERFTDFMVRDVITGECFRADKLLEDAIDTFIAAHPELTVQEKEEHRIIQRQADAFDEDELHSMLQKYNVKSPSNGTNDLTKPFPFNLMFKTTIGPEGTAVGYLRPETAQGLFVNFRRLLDFNQQKMPFAAAQIGLGFRNEISPRNGLLRVREFCMAEIEHFVHPQHKNHAKFNNVADLELVLFPREAQLGTGRTIKMKVGEAVSKGVINNETLAYFMARTFLWLKKIGVDPNRMRFRQHLSTEMAHYAADCWDVEIQTSYGWVESAGHADRACYDLKQHSEWCHVPMLAAKRLDEPVQIERFVAEPNRKTIGPKFKTTQKQVIAALEALDSDAVEALKKSIDESGTALVDGYEISADMVNIKLEKKMVHEEKYTPSVIEPSYGIGRILYAVLEHSFLQREGDEQRSVMRFKPCVAPIKVGLYRLVNNTEFDNLVNTLSNSLQSAGIVCKVDSSSGTIGRRYAKADELGIPFGITVDFQTLIDNSVTIRERDSMAQIRVSLSNLLSIIQSLATERVSWDELSSKYAPVVVQDDEDDKTSKKTDLTKSSSTKIEYHLRASFSRPN